MAEFTRVNGSGFYGLDTMYSTSQIDVYLVTPGVDVSAEASVVEGAIEAMVREVSPLMYYVAADGLTMHIVTDNHHNDAATLQARIRNLGATVGPNDVDLSGATVALGNQITVAAAGTGPVQTGD